MFCDEACLMSRVQKLVDGLVDEFVSCGLMRRERNTVKIHVTLMNSKWRENTEENFQSNGDAAINSNPRNLRKNRLSFDASKILEVQYLFVELSVLNNIKCI